MFRKTNLIIILIMVWLTACSQPQAEVEPSPAKPRNLTVMTHDSFAVSEQVIAELRSRA